MAQNYLLSKYAVKIIGTHIGFLLICLFTSNGANAQFIFPQITGPISVTAGSPVTLPLNDSANTAAVTSGLYRDFLVTADWTNTANAGSYETHILMTTASGSVNVYNPTSVGTSTPTTISFAGSLPTTYNPAMDGLLSLTINQYFSSANWSNIVVTLYPAPPCPEPSQLGVANVTASSADLLWHENGTSANWNIEWGAAGFSPTGVPTISGATNPQPISGLSAQTDYEFYVMSDCGPDGTSVWSGPFSFKSACVSQTQLFENFDALPSGPVMPDCWDSLVFGTGNLEISTNSPASGIHSIRQSSDGPANQTIVILPQFSNVNAGTHQLRFKVRVISAPGQLEVGYITDINDPNSFTLFKTIHITNTSYVETVVLIPVIIAPGARLAIRNPGINTHAHYWDDIYYEARASLNFTFESGSWTPEDPMSYAGPGDNLQIVDGSAVLNKDVEVNHITIDPGAALNIENVLKVNGDITNNGSMVFVSNASTTGQLDVVPATSTITGEVTVQRYIPARRAFRFLSFGVNTSTSINANLQEGATSSAHNPNPGFGTHITGSATGTNGFDTTPSGNPSMFILDNMAQTWVAAPNTDATIMSAGDAIRLMVRGDRSIDVTDNSVTSTNTTLRATGVLATGIQTQTVMSDQAGAFNFFGNPYQAIVDMNSVIASSANINDAYYYVWDPKMGARGAYVTVDLPAGTNSSGSAVNSYLQPGQAAFVVTLATGTTTFVQFNETDKAVSQPHTAVFNINSKLDIRLYEATAFANNDKAADGLRFKFAADGTNAINSKDALKFYNQDENLASSNGSNLYSIENRALPQIAEVIPLYIDQYRHNGYVLEAEVRNLEDVQAHLRDNYTETETALDNDALNLYPFTVDPANAASKASDRFEIFFTQRVLGEEDTTFGADFALFPNPAKGQQFYIATRGLEGEQVSITMNNMLGQQVLSQDVSVPANGRLEVKLPGLPSGVYNVTLHDANGNRFTAKLINN